MTVDARSPEFKRRRSLRNIQRGEFHWSAGGICSKCERAVDLGAVWFVVKIAEKVFKLVCGDCRRK